MTSGGKKKSKAKPDRSKEEVAMMAVGFLHVPPLWVMANPPKGGIRADTPDRDEVVFHAEVPQGVRLEASRDGLFVFDLERWSHDLRIRTLEPDRQERTRRRCALLNAYLCALQTANREVLFEKMLVTPKTLVLSTSLGSNSFACADGISRSVISTKRRGAEGWGDARHVKDFWFSPSFSMTEETLERATHLFATFLDGDALFNIQILELCLHACVALEEYAYELALVSAWSVSEKLLGRRWQRMIRERNIRGKRSKRLKDGRTFSASVIIEGMELAGVLDASLLDTLQQVRKARNDWLHDLGALDRELAVSALQAALAMVRAELGLAVSLRETSGFSNQ